MNPVDALARALLRLAHRLGSTLEAVTGYAPESAGVALWRGRRLLLVKCSYGRFYSFPGGLLKWRESVLDAAVRELREEVGLTLQPAQLKFVRRYGKMSLFEARTECADEPTADLREIAWSAFVHPQEALALPLSDRVRDYLESLNEV